jgi:gamma-glutamylcyclotransferase (GGCT)/AIG2-like uncharacterized protein YtfP
VRHLLLYGSLRRGEPGARAMGLDRRLGFVRVVTIRGRLYDLGDYPGLVLGPLAGRVRAELFVIRDPGVTAALDGFEGYNPDDPSPYDPATGHGSLYLRQSLWAGGVQAWIYVLNLATPPGPEALIRSGDWVGHRRGW